MASFLSARNDGAADVSRAILFTGRSGGRRFARGYTKRPTTGPFQGLHVRWARLMTRGPGLLCPWARSGRACKRVMLGSVQPESSARPHSSGTRASRVYSTCGGTPYAVWRRVLSLSANIRAAGAMPTSRMAGVKSLQVLEVAWPHQQNNAKKPGIDRKVGDRSLSCLAALALAGIIVAARARSQLEAQTAPLVGAGVTLAYRIWLP